jgi:hypothetical protein
MAPPLTLSCARRRFGVAVLGLQRRRRRPNQRGELDARPRRNE